MDARGAPVSQPVTVYLSLSDDPSLIITGSTSSGTVTFLNIPSRTVVLEACTADNQVGVTGGGSPAVL